MTEPETPPTRGVRSWIGARTGNVAMPSMDRSELTASVTSAVAAIPDGMASGVLAGVNPVYGLYTLIVGMPTAALLASTQIMVFNTTSAMTLVASDGLGERAGDDRVQALFALALVCGVFQLAMGILGLGFLTRFVSNAVMTGFLTGIAVLIILGQLWDLTGYSGEGDGKLQQTANLLRNLDEIDPWTTVVGLTSIIIMFALQSGRFGSFNLLIALGVAVAYAQVLKWFDYGSIALVSSLGDIPRSLPTPDLPRFTDVPAVLLAGIATGIVGLLQAAGVAQQFPNRDKSEPDDSRDFIAQGAGNVVNSMFQAMPGGGSLSGTALFSAAGGRSRWGIVIQAVFVIVLILVFSDLLSIIPMAALAALLVYSALLSINLHRLTTVATATRSSFLSMLATFLATLVMPLQQAVILGVVLAAILFVYRSSTDVRVVELRREGLGVIEAEPPATLASNTSTVLGVYGSLFYAGARTLAERLPSVGDAENANVILRLRGHGEIGSTFLNVLTKYAENIRANGGQFMLTGIDPATRERLVASGHLDAIGPENVYAATATIGESTRLAMDAARALLGMPGKGDDDRAG